MSKFENFVRAHGADAREHVTKLYLAHGDTAGQEIARRWIWEIADVIGEVHGPTVVKDMLQEALDAIQLDVAPPIADPTVLAGDDPFEQIMVRNSAALEAQTGAFATMAEEIGRLQAPSVSRGERIWRVFDRVIWWPAFMTLGALLAGAGQ